MVDADALYSTTGQGLHRSVDPVDKEVYLYSQFETADAQRVFACFDQPDLKSVYTWHVTVPAHWSVDLQLAGRADRAPATSTGTKTLHFEHVGADVDLHHRDLRRAVPRGAQDARRHRPRHLLPPVDEAVPRRRRHLPHHRAGLRLLPRAVRRALPAAEIRPAVRARVQRRRDGELRLRRARRAVLHLPVAGHRLRVREPRQHDPARDGAHVVRRPRDHALVGRPVAERVVRRVGEPLGQRARDPVHRRVDHVPVGAQELGLPPGPALLDPPGLLRHAGHGGGRGQLRRHHVRQGRERHQAARGVRRDRRVRRRPARLLRQARLGQRDLRRPAHVAGGGVRQARCATSPPSGWRPPRSTRCGRRS